MEDTKLEEQKFERMNVKESTKREFDIIAAVERRPVYKVIDDALKTYKHIAYAKGTKKGKKLESVSVAEIVADH